MIYLFGVGRQVRRGSISSAANVWWRCAQYLLLPLVARCLETIDVRIFFMCVVVTVWGLWECLLCYGRC